MTLIYDLAFLLISLFYLPVYIFKRKFHAGFKARLGAVSAVPGGNPVWFHAVSVGEAMAVRPFLTQFRLRLPGKKIVISTVTVTGNKIARGLAGSDGMATYLPLDFSFVVRKYVNTLAPSLVVIAETEIWPNLITCLARKNIPVVLINGRLSDRSFKGYRILRKLISPVLRKIDLFCMQTRADAERLISLGVDISRVRVTGNLKFDIPCVSAQEPQALKERLGARDSDLFLVAGSTHPGEEAHLLAAYKNLNLKFPRLRLLLCPRHPDRSAEVALLIKNFEFNPARLSEFSSRYTDRKTVFILDTVGELKDYYSMADIVFVGGSLVKKGGHNIIEPAAFGKPVLFGPQMFNFRDIAALFLESRAAIQVPDAAGLEDQARKLLEDPLSREELGKRALALVAENQGAAQKCLHEMENIIKRI